MKTMKMRKSVVAAMMLLGLVVAPVAASISLADDPAPAAQGGGDLVDASGKPVDAEQKKAADTGFWGVVTGSGVLGIILWAALFLDGAAAIYFTVDCWVLIKPQKLMPQSLINNVQGAVAEGDVMKAIKACEAEPSPMSNVLAAAFQHVEDGYDVIQESVNAAADLEIERIMQRLHGAGHDHVLRHAGFRRAGHRRARRQHLAGPLDDCRRPRGVHPRAHALLLDPQ